MKMWDIIDLNNSDNNQYNIDFANTMCFIEFCENNKAIVDFKNHIIKIN